MQRPGHLDTWTLGHGQQVLHPCAGVLAAALGRARSESQARFGRETSTPAPFSGTEVDGLSEIRKAHRLQTGRRQALGLIAIDRQGPAEAA